MVSNICGKINVFFSLQHSQCLTHYIEVTVNFKESSYSVIEGEQNLTLTLQVDGLYARPISATIGCRNGSALSQFLMIFSQIFVIHCHTVGHI